VDFILLHSHSTRSRATHVLPPPSSCASCLLPSCSPSDLLLISLSFPSASFSFPSSFLRASLKFRSRVESSTSTRVCKQDRGSTKVEGRVLSALSALPCALLRPPMRLPARPLRAHTPSCGQAREAQGEQPRKSRQRKTGLDRGKTGRAIGALTCHLGQVVVRFEHLEAPPAAQSSAPARDF
jgi:hypothetical protein